MKMDDGGHQPMSIGPLNDLGGIKRFKSLSKDKTYIDKLNRNTNKWIDTQSNISNQ